MIVLVASWIPTEAKLTQLRVSLSRRLLLTQRQSKADVAAPRQQMLIHYQRLF